MVPAAHLVFKCFTVDPKEIKLCIVGQDPYPSKRHATGYAFDVPKGLTRQSLYVFQLIGQDYGIDFTSFEPLKKDVMLLNANLTTEGGITKAHDWRWLTKQVVNYIKLINKDCKFVFLGTYAHTINDVEGINLYHPAANPRTGRKLFNKTFFELTQDVISWKTIYND